jgi:predicted O-methyltransferase YrrM
MLADRCENSSSGATTSVPVWHKLLREAVRPLVRGRKAIRRDQSPRLLPAAESKASRLCAFDSQSCTVEPDGLELLKKLVRESTQYDGPIIEIGTLLGITATHMALVKQSRQKIITVDNYCWNPWGLPADAHHALARQVLLYLTSCGEVQQLRMDKAEFYDSYRGPAPALVFLDAWHTYEETKKDIEWAIRCGAQLIAGHDYCDQFDGVRQVVDEYGGPRTLAGTVWVLNPQTPS